MQWRQGTRVELPKAGMAVPEPDDPITRLQTAVFLGKALGLHRAP